MAQSGETKWIKADNWKKMRRAGTPVDIDSDSRDHIGLWEPAGHGF